MAFLKRVLGFAGEVGADAAIIKGVPYLWKLITGAYGAYEKLPPEIQKKVPGFLGLSLADEQIFNGVLSQLDLTKQVVITRFLCEKCQDYERNRFINVVAGMEVAPGSPAEVEKKWNKTAGKFDEKTKPAVPTKDRRFDFLDKFANVITDEFQGDLDKAYAFCVAGRMIIPDPFYQKVLRGFSEGGAWFRNLILQPAGAKSTAELIEKANKKLSENSADLDKKLTSFKDRAKAWRDSAPKRR
jgi:hypothetical protein